MNRRSRPGWVYASLSVLLVLLVLTFWLGEDSGDKVPAPQVDLPQVSGPEVVFEEAGAIKDVEPQLQPPSVKKALVQRHGIALILDDVGYDLPALRRAIGFNFPMAIAILPNAPHAAAAANLAHAAGYPVMLHMPMEPANPHYRQRMDKSFIRAGMQREQVRRLMREALFQVPHVEGVNNHMGSRLTVLEEPMRWVMEVCREQKLFFVDSRTNKDSVAARLAKEGGLRWGERRVFLDDSVEPEKLRKSWQAARKRLKKNGFVIVIAHPHKETLDFLQQEVSAQDRAVMVPLGKLLFPAEKQQEAADAG